MTGDALISSGLESVLWCCTLLFLNGDSSDKCCRTSPSFSRGSDHRDNDVRTDAYGASDDLALSNPPVELDDSNDELECFEWLSVCVGASADIADSVHASVDLLAVSLYIIV